MPPTETLFVAPPSERGLWLPDQFLDELRSQEQTRVKLVVPEVGLPISANY